MLLFFSGSILYFVVVVVNDASTASVLNVKYFNAIYSIPKNWLQSENYILYIRTNKKRFCIFYTEESMRKDLVYFVSFHIPHCILNYSELNEISLWFEIYRLKTSFNIEKVFKHSTIEQFKCNTMKKNKMIIQLPLNLKFSGIYKKVEV